MEIKRCKQCQVEIPRTPHANNKQFCNVGCRELFYKPKAKENQLRYWERHAGEYNPLKCPCLICGKWFIQVGTHIYQKHKMTCREYQELLDLEVKKGILPDWYRIIKGNEALDNGTWQNLTKGKQFRFIKGDRRAGKYHRSPITIRRLQKLHLYNTHAKS